MKSLNKLHEKIVLKEFDRRMDGLLTISDLNSFKQSAKRMIDDMVKNEGYMKSEVIAHLTDELKRL